MVAHNPEAGITRIKLPSGSKKVSQASPALTDHARSPQCGFCPTSLVLGCDIPYEKAIFQGCNMLHAPACKCLAELLTAEAVCAGDPQHMPRHDWPGGRRWQDREAHAEGRQCLPQVQGQEEQLAQGTLPFNACCPYNTALCSLTF